MYNGPVFEVDMSVQINEDLRVRGELQLDNPLPLATDDANGMLSSDLHKKITNIDTAPIKNSQNLVSSGGTYSALDNKADKSNTYNKTEVDTFIGEKADKANSLSGYGINDAYNRIDADNLLANKADKASSLATYGIDDAYTKTEVDSSMQAMTDLVQNLFQTALDKMHPIGTTIYWSPVENSTEDLSTAEKVAAKLGGTWVQIKDRFILAAGDNYTAGDTGGSEAPALLSHGHYVDGETDASGSHTHSVICSADAGSTLSGTTNDYIYKNPSGGSTMPMTSAGSHTHSVTGTTSQSSSGDQSKGNLPPYLTMYCWKRTA